MLAQPSLSSPSRQRRRLTHIDTLNNLTPKGRRRIRRLLELKAGAPVGKSEGMFARSEAQYREKLEAQRVAALPQDQRRRAA